MYTGNGVTKKFLLPSGYDGNTVLLKMPSGETVEMLQGESYIITDNAVCFLIPPPSGVEVCFEVDDTTKLINKNSGNYIIIYADGTIKQVNEDPSIILEEAKKLLTEAKKTNAEALDNLSGTKEYIKGLFNTSGADLDGRLDGYARSAKDIALSAAEEARKSVFADWEMLSKRLNIQEIDLIDVFKKIRLAMNKANEFQENIITKIKQQSEPIFQEAEEYLKDLKKIMLDIQATADNSKIKINETLQTAINEMKATQSKEFELLKSLRLKLEKDYEQFNSQRLNYLNYLRGEVNG